MLSSIQNILFFLFLISILCTACENDIAEVRHLFPPYEDIPTEIASNVEMMYSDSFQVRIIVKAPKLIRYGGADMREEFTEGFFVDFLGENQQKTSHLTAEKATKKTIVVQDEKGRKIREPVVIIKDNVQLISRGGDTLITEELIWYENLGLLTSNKYVEIKKPKEWVVGYGFETDKESSNWKIRNVIGEFESKRIQEDFKD